MAGERPAGGGDRNSGGFVSRLLRAVDDKLVVIVISAIFGSASFLGSLGVVAKNPTVRAEAYTNTMAREDNLRHDKGIEQLSHRIDYLEAGVIEHHRKAERYIEKILRLEDDCAECKEELKTLRELMYGSPYHQGGQ